MHTAKEYADAGQLTVFVGAGASALPPSSLPTWLDVNRAVLAALAGEAPGPHAPLIEALVRERLASGRLPPEYAAEVIAQRFRYSYFDVLTCLDGDAPNAVHHALVALAAKGRLRAIVTTNFDRLVEVAFARAGVPLVVRARDCDYGAPAFDPTSAPRGPCQLLKLHGSADDPTTLIDTLAQRKRGLAPGKLEALRALHGSTHWLFVGWSGADLEAEPNYLLQRSEAKASRGFTWLARTGTLVRNVVTDIAALHGPKSRIVSGELPSALDALLADCPVVLPDASLVAEPPDIERHAAAWAARQGPALCGLALADLAVAAGDPEAALALVEGLEHTLARTTVRERATLDNTRASLLLRTGRTDLALELSDRERATWDMLGDEAGCARAMDFAARVHEGRGELALAYTLFERSLEIKERMGDAAGMCRSLAGLATVYRRRGDVDRALTTNDRILALKVALGDEPGRALCLAAMARLHEQRGDSEKACALHDAARLIFARLGDERGEAGALAGLAHIHRGRGELDLACELYTRAVALRARLGDARGEAAARLGLASALTALGRCEPARAHATTALASFEAASDRHGAAMAHNALGDVLREAGELGLARARYDASLALKLLLGDERGRAISLLGLSKAIRRESGANGAANDLVREALAISLRLGDARGASSARFELGIPDVPAPPAVDDRRTASRAAIRAIL